ncbi:hypothetical protein MKW98_014650 [Papaver atlanticum]|uniref:Uncharacterized protein n=1 Tax=Papaver atlanticum TaxID=357466 RepID=A0AAD4SF16_9MAGN|nr:hypothetical protein MKW98_014650 [Papaver atlanticum]
MSFLIFSSPSPCHLPSHSCVKNYLFLYASKLFCVVVPKKKKSTWVSSKIQKKVIPFLLPISLFLIRSPKTSTRVSSKIQKKGLIDVNGGARVAGEDKCCARGYANVRDLKKKDNGEEWKKKGKHYEMRGIWGCKYREQAKSMAVVLAHKNKKQNSCTNSTRGNPFSIRPKPIAEHASLWIVLQISMELISLEGKNCQLGKHIM